MSLYSRFVSAFLFPLHEKIKGHSTISAYREMEKTQWLSPEEIQSLQFRSLRDFLCDIDQQVPYYHDLFSRLDFDPAEIKSIADLQKLPLLGKVDIRQFTDSFKAKNATNLQRFNTGGSSGEPLIFYLGSRRVSHDVAAKRRATRWWGVDIGDREIVVWGSPIELSSQDKVRQIRDWLFRSSLLSAFEMSKKNLDGFVEAIQRARPTMLFGYPSSLSVIAKHADEIGCSFTDAGIQVAFVTSERLYDHQRDQIEETFSCPVANGYGGRDAGFIAHQCPAGSMHITAEDIIVEIVDSEGCVLPHGESGEIVVTHLRTNDFPFVRYRTGDIGTLSPHHCECGRGLPVLEKIEGRTTDFVVAQDGTLVHGLALIYTLRDMPGVHSFKIIQKSVNEVLVQLVANTAGRTVLKDTVTRDFRERLGHTVEVNFDFTDSIPREKSGKFRYVVSNVS